MSTMPAECSRRAIFVLCLEGRFVLCLEGRLGFGFSPADLSREKSKAVLESPLKKTSP